MNRYIPLIIGRETDPGWIVPGDGGTTLVRDWSVANSTDTIIGGKDVI